MLAAAIIIGGALMGLGPLGYFALKYVEKTDPKAIAERKRREMRKRCELVRLEKRRILERQRAEFLPTATNSTLLIETRRATTREIGEIDKQLMELADEE